MQYSKQKNNFGESFLSMLDKTECQTRCCTVPRTVISIKVILYQVLPQLQRKWHMAAPHLCHPRAHSSTAAQCFPALHCSTTHIRGFRCATPTCYPASQQLQPRSERLQSYSASFSTHTGWFQHCQRKTSNYVWDFNIQELLQKQCILQNIQIYISLSLLHQPQLYLLTQCTTSNCSCCCSVLRQARLNQSIMSMKVNLKKKKELE